MNLPTSFVGHESPPINANVNVDIQALVWEGNHKPTPMRRETSVITVSTHPHRATPPQIRIPQPVEVDASTGPLHRAPVHWARWLPIRLVSCFIAGIAHGQEPVYPLQPPDRSSSLDIEVFAYVMTNDWAEFLGIREDILLRVMDIVEQSGTGFAFPSQTLYFARDGGLDTHRTESAEAQVRQWRDEGCLPFPNFSPEQMRQRRGTVVYPPPGSPEASTTGSEPEIVASNPPRQPN